jgi:hypothetical protein
VQQTLKQAGTIAETLTDPVQRQIGNDLTGVALPHQYRDDQRQNIGEAGDQTVSNRPGPQH